jgi:hypothetical protein
VVRAEYDRAELPVVSGENPGIADRSNDNRREVRQVDAGVHVSVGEIEGKLQFGVGWSFAPVHPIEQAASEGDRRPGMFTRANQQIATSANTGHNIMGSSGRQFSRIRCRLP